MTNKTLTTKQALRYSRQILLMGFDLDKQEILINSRVLMIGVGGLGCAASQYLVAAGIGKITLVDDDIVETTNLQRQILHFENSVGDKKVESARRTLNSINHFVDVQTIDKRLGADELDALALQHDLILDCSDNLETRNLLNDACYRSGIPLVSGAAIRMEGQIFCAIPALKTACYRCVSHFFGEQNLSCVESGVMSPVVGIVGASQANEAIKILTQFGEQSVNKLQIFDAMTSTWESFKVKPLPLCKTCSSIR
ncbi:MAG: molybdopterin/thiamine biosynthesis adenylyltransferase [Gammaproteobacteria bacterium]|jgi:molybdopterin/thiamine biosynthesis adenylyltransferase